MTVVRVAGVSPCVAEQALQHACGVRERWLLPNADGVAQLLLLLAGSCGHPSADALQTLYSSMQVRRGLIERERAAGRSRAGEHTHLRRVFDALTQLLRHRRDVRRGARHLDDLTLRRHVHVAEAAAQGRVEERLQRRRCRGRGGAVEVARPPQHDEVARRDGLEHREEGALRDEAAEVEGADRGVHDQVAHPTHGVCGEAGSVGC